MRASSLCTLLSIRLKTAHNNRVCSKHQAVCDKGDSATLRATSQSWNQHTHAFSNSPALVRAAPAYNFTASQTQQYEGTALQQAMNDTQLEVCARQGRTPAKPGRLRRLAFVR